MRLSMSMSFSKISSMTISISFFKLSTQFWSSSMCDKIHIWGLGYPEACETKQETNLFRTTALKCEGTHMVEVT